MGDGILTASETAKAIAAVDDESTRLRIFFEFMRGATEDARDAMRLIIDEPAGTGDERFDSLLAAAAEYLAYQHGKRAPLWAEAPGRFLHRAWWIADLPSARAHALVNSPVSFQRRGIYLDRHDLQTA